MINNKGDMTVMEVREILEIVISIYEHNGIEVNNDHCADISEIDSLTFVTIVVDIENQLNIFYPDEYLTLEVFSSLESLSEIIKAEIDGK